MNLERYACGKQAQQAQRKNLEADQKGEVYEALSNAFLSVLIVFHARGYRVRAERNNRNHRWASA
jgi:hypothetical protein